MYFALPYRSNTGRTWVFLHICISQLCWLGFIMTFRSCQVTLYFYLFFKNFSFFFFCSFSFHHSQCRVDISCTNAAGDSGACSEDFTRSCRTHGGTTNTTVRVATTVHLSRPAALRHAADTKFRGEWHY